MLFHGSSAVEHSPVKRIVAGSIPARGAKCFLRDSVEKIRKATHRPHKPGLAGALRAQGHRVRLPQPVSPSG